MATKVPAVIDTRIMPESPFERHPKLVATVSKPQEFTTRSKIDFPLGLVLVGLNILFFVQVLQHTGTLGSIRLLVPVSYALLMAGSGLRATETQGGPLLSVPFYRNWFRVLLIVVIIMVGRDLLEGVSPNTLYLANLPYMLPIMAFIGQRREDWFWFNRVLVLHAVVGCILGVMSVVALDHSVYIPIAPVARAYVLGSTFASVAGLGWYAVMFLIASYAHQPRVGKVSALVGLVLLLLIGVLGQFKSSIVSVVSISTLSLVAHSRSGQKVAWRKILVPIGTLLCLMVALFQFNYFFGSRLLESGFRGLGVRTEAVSSSLGTKIWSEETRFVAQDLQPFDWLTGRGGAGTWDSSRYLSYRYSEYGTSAWDSEQRGMAHFGLMHLILKGGVPLLVLFLLFPFGVALRTLFTSRDPLTLAASVVVVQSLVGLIMGGFPRAEPWYVVTMLCAGRCAAGAISSDSEQDCQMQEASDMRSS